MKKKAFRRMFREYFTFSRSERKGIVVLLVLMVLLAVANRVIFYFERPREVDREEFLRLLAELEQGERPLERQKSSLPERLFLFDPNTIDSLALDSLALPAQVKRNLLRYRASGGVLKNPDDLRKIYGMNDSAYVLVHDYIRIMASGKGKNAVTIRERPVPGPPEATRSALPAGYPNPEQPGRSRDSVPEEKTAKIKTEINRATADDLIRLNGIGPVLSGRIIKYRELLGGFYSVDQLLEVYGLKQETFNRIKDELKADTFEIARININFAEVRDLGRHPYLGWEAARKIVRYREKTGFIGYPRLLLHDSVLPAERFFKIRPYLQTKD